MPEAKSRWSWTLAVAPRCSTALSTSKIDEFELTWHSLRDSLCFMHILLTNDDGIYAPGLRALEEELQKLGAVDVIAPLVEQSGVGHAITYLTPLMARELYDGPRRRGWAVEG